MPSNKFKSVIKYHCSKIYLKKQSHCKKRNKKRFISSDQIKPIPFHGDLTKNVIDANKKVALLSLEEFDSWHEISVSEGKNYNITCHHASSMDSSTKTWAFKLCKEFMMDMYEQSSAGWSDENKYQELNDISARYLIVREDESAKPVAFTHFRFDMDYEDEVLYWNKRSRKMSSSPICPRSNGAVSSQSALSTLSTSISVRKPEGNVSEQEGGVRSPAVSSSSSRSSSSNQTDFQSFGSFAVPTKRGVDRNSRRSTSSLPSKAVRPTSLLVAQSSTTSLNRCRRTSKLSSAEDIGHTFSFKAFPSDTDNSAVSSPQLPLCAEFQGKVGTREKIRFSIGYIYIRLLFAFMSNSLQVDILPNYFFPQKEFYKESNLYVKLIVITGGNRLKRSTWLTTFQNSPVLATFSFQINYKDLIRSSMVVSLCKNLENDQNEGMLIGSGSVHFDSLGITDSLNEDFDSDVIKVLLLDSTPQQLVVNSVNTILYLASR